MNDNVDDARQWIIEQLRFDRVGHDNALSYTPDWDQVVAVAQRERFAGLLLASDAAQFLPPTARTQLEEIRLQMRVSNAWLLMQLEEWLSRFDAVGIPTVVLKGAALIALVYGRSALRPMSDIDLLVHPEDFDRAGQLLQAEGFSPYREVTSSNERTIRTQIAWVRQKPPGGGIELHWHLLDSGYYARKVPMQWFWDHAISVPFGARNMRVFSPEAQLLHLAAHLELHHAGTGLWWLYDVAALLHKFSGALDWNLVIDTARRFEWGQSLRVAVERAQTTFGVSVPDSVSARLAALRATWHERVARTLAEPSAHLAAFLFDGWEQGSWRARTRYLWRSLFPSAEFMRMHGPIRNRRDLIVQYARRLGRGLYRVPRALGAGVAQMWRMGWERR